jgi:hypothetical protein
MAWETVRTFEMINGMLNKSKEGIPEAVKCDLLAWKLI